MNKKKHLINSIETIIDGINKVLYNIYAKWRQEEEHYEKRVANMDIILNEFKHIHRRLDDIIEKVNDIHHMERTGTYPKGYSPYQPPTVTYTDGQPPIERHSTWCAGEPIPCGEAGFNRNPYVDPESLHEYETMMEQARREKEFLRDVELDKEYWRNRWKEKKGKDNG